MHFSSRVTGGMLTEGRSGVSFKIIFFFLLRGGLIPSAGETLRLTLTSSRLPKRRKDLSR